MNNEEFKELLDNMSDEEFLKKVDEKNAALNAALKVSYSCFLQSPIGLCLSNESEEYKKKMQEFEKNHSTADNILQDAMIMAVMKAFIAGAKFVIEENICLNCRGSKDCNKSVKDECINFLLNIK